MDQTDVLKDWLLKAIADHGRTELLRRYEVDERRRLHLASKGRSRYQRVMPDL